MALDHVGTKREQSGMDSRDCLAHYPFVVVRIACRVCSRRGSYRLARLAAKYGQPSGPHRSLLLRLPLALRGAVKEGQVGLGVYPSLSFLHAAAEQMVSEKRPCFIYQFGDHDPSGVDAARAIEESLREMAPHAEINFERMAVTPAQIDAWSLPSRPTKASDPRSKNWTGRQIRRTRRH